MGRAAGVVRVIMGHVSIFGLSDRTRVDRVEIRRIGGATNVFKELGTDQEATLVEGSSK
jgi:hypothetical protein